ncbi:MAG: Lrp/AsnC ligand binding domain-containing protein [Candidatus Caldarchaeales archaeon]
MAIYAYILLRCSMGKLKNVIEEAKRLEKLKAVYPVTGRFDAIIEVEVEDLKRLEDLVIDHIQKIDGVERTETLLSVG